jgi:TctA family transporter
LDVVDDEDSSRALYVTSGVLGGALSDILNGVISGIIVNTLDYLFNINIEDLSQNFVFVIFLASLSTIWVCFWAYKKVFSKSDDVFVLGKNRSGKTMMTSAIYLQRQKSKNEHSTIPRVSPRGLLAVVLFASLAGSLVGIPFGLVGAIIAGGILGLLVGVWKTRDTGEPFE